VNLYVPYDSNQSHAFDSKMFSPAPPYNSAIFLHNPSAIILGFHFLFYILHFRSSPALSSPLLH